MPRAHLLLLDSRRPASADPTMLLTMKQAKIMPCGMRSLLGLRGGSKRGGSGGG